MKDDISKIIFMQYKATNVVAILTKNNKIAAFLIRIVVILFFILSLIIYLSYQKSHPAISFISIVVSTLLVFLLYFKVYKYVSKQLNIEQKVPMLSPQEIARIKLKDILIYYNMFSKDGIEYLISIYNKKNRIIKFSWVAIIGIIFSSIISDITYLILFSTHAEYMVAYHRVLFIKEIIASNIESMITIIMILVFSIALFTYIFKNTKVLLLTLFGFRYGSLIYDLEYILLPELINCEAKPFNLKRSKINKRNNKRKNRKTLL